MKQGDVFSSKDIRWYEPQHSLLGGKYFTHVWGSSYVVSGKAAAAISTLPVGLLRFFANEGACVCVCLSTKDKLLSPDRYHGWELDAGVQPHAQGRPANV